MADERRKAELIAVLDRARSRLAANAGGLRDDLDPMVRVKASYQRHGLAWLSGAALMGLVLAKLPARKKIVKVDAKGQRLSEAPKMAKAGLIFGALKLAFDLSKPLLADWVSQRAAAYVQRPGRGRGTGDR